MQHTSQNSSDEGPAKQQPAQGKGETRVLPETAWAGDPALTGIPPQGSVMITIARQFGSGGSEIAHLVALAGGLKYLDQDIIAEVAKRVGLDMQYAVRREVQTSGTVGHILDAIQASNPFNNRYMLSPSIAQQQSKEMAYLQLTQRVILEMANEGNAIIVGRGSQFLLHNAPRTLHIYTFAPLPDRIEYVMNQFHINRNVAKQLIEQRDYEQESYLRHYYGADGRQPTLYHLLINTGLFSFEHAASFICQALPVVKEST